MKSFFAAIIWSMLVYHDDVWFKYKCETKSTSAQKLQRDANGAPKSVFEASGW